MQISITLLVGGSCRENAIHAKTGISDYIECEADGTPRPMISWYRNGKPILENTYETSKGEYFFTGTTKSRLYFDCPQAEESGFYTCVANNSKREVNRTFEFIVEEENEIASEESLSLCELKSHGISWFKSTRDVYDVSDDDKLVRIKNSDEYKIEDKGDLIIKNLNSSESLHYYCKVSNQYGKDSQMTYFTLLD
ncbi:Neural/ectodermal development factor IMP-L2-like protein [Dinothrombium tinctorium]|uniref:Neural/ectodermal development factor IMP-L2-like protein n=1 Tax=Dinothrombium tinctorium TaxID=1965070 RepID=A0A3S4Q9U8_9ACAR|nr:Neural/ectodermal development factor IMP-L2-like protein [Dinothrombium tinctorium]